MVTPMKRMPVMKRCCAKMVTSNFLKHTKSRGIRKILIERFNCRIAGLFEVIAKNVKSVLDVGCGEGFLLDRMHQIHPEISYYGCDINIDALNYAKQHNPEIQFRQSDINTIETGSEYDLIICTEVLEHLQDPAVALDNINRLCMGGGMLSYLFLMSHFFA